jgi:hypothetical protein
MSTCLALRWRSGGHYLRERVLRRLVPVVFGLLVFVPPEGYLGRLTHANYSSSFLPFYPTFFQIQPND